MRRISEIVRNQHPITLPPGASARRACEAMRDHRVGAILVTGRDHKLLGIFSGRDAVGRVLAAGRNADTTKLSEVMTPDPDSMPAAGTAIEALRLMNEGGFRHVPVVEDGKVVGIVSYGDFRGLEHARLDEETGLWERL